MTTAAPVLELTGICKRFTGVQALQDVSLRLRAGEVHALMGQNGAGKSTLIKVLTGVYPPDAGTVTLAGREIRPASPQEAQRLGISTVYQEVNLCPNLSVAENIFAGRYPRKGWQGGWRIDWKRMHREAEALLARLDLHVDVTRLLSGYPVAVQQMVAIARALSVQAQVLVLDEPTSSLDESEVQRLFDVLRRLRDEGLAILFVTHFLDEVYAISDRITVLRNGRHVGEYAASELDRGALVTAMVGRELAPAAQALRRSPAAAPEGGVLLEARGLGRKGQLHPVDLQLRRGEVVGLAGLLGAGRTELARLLFGLDAADAGELRLGGRVVSFDHPAQAVRHGLGLCPEDRKSEGIVGELSVRENIALALQARMGLRRTLSRRRQQELAERYIRALGIRTPDAETPIAQLSGGNQQKALLARWLATQPALLILDEPTRGIDVAAKQEIMGEILRLAEEGMAVLFISSELDEVVRLSDRVVVLRDRRKVGELPVGTSEAQICDLIAAGA
ncbi:sugar ABC transporter ATP-binding protein [Caldimonas thermodepolymerans]|uniref:Monosaccharide ABC transporter ATP-binding protein (CUT2 family) n=1 Tax=Caldimonas thermodepolymerans TaxID=215580 RepID=A0AA46HUK2_9BURK|nr:sugar ABC transporter ATP-binding protein [Caldimonas thermodepolymerans]TCP03256.1 monosaccharide ABC transporter ATP-binding protein (CUT2 family) [Caldimonas thermodepolymerans]UZG47950.1 sugar ABC transporter ATP-binding protein [Caldimonas thermodepolymerans]